MKRAMRIACPRCGFQPVPKMRWQCRPGCGYTWHTFATHGIYPRCSKMWHDTQCPRCKFWSLQDAWYHDDELFRQALRKAPVDLERELS